MLSKAVSLLWSVQVLIVSWLQLNSCKVQHLMGYYLRAQSFEPIWGQHEPQQLRIFFSYPVNAINTKSKWVTFAGREHGSPATFWEGHGSLRSQLGKQFIWQRVSVAPQIWIPKQETEAKRAEKWNNNQMKNKRIIKIKNTHADKNIISPSAISIYVKSISNIREECNHP